MHGVTSGTALREGHTESAALLINSHADVNAKDTARNLHMHLFNISEYRTKADEMTALMLAAIGGHTETAALLIKNHADVNVTDKDGNTALICAADRGHTEIVALLINNHADVNVTDNGGRTALMWAA